METNELKSKAKEFFKKHKSVRCPAFPKEKVYFNSKGMSHLFYKGAGKVFSRPVPESNVRINLLSRALRVITKMSLFQEESIFIDKRGRECRYFSFEAVVDNRRVKVIIRQVGNGQKHFWSVIPAWRRVRGQIVNCRGSLGND